MKTRSTWGQKLVIAVPYFWLLVFFFAPFVIVFKISFSNIASSIPPYEPIFTEPSAWWEQAKLFTLDNYLWLMEDDLYYKAYLYSVGIAFVSTVIILLIGYPLAYGIAQAPKSIRPILVMLVILPFWTSFLIRVYAWIGILKQNGLLNQLLLWIGVIDEPLIILNTYWAVFIGIVYSYLPFMVLPIYAALEKMDVSLVEAGEDLGCSKFKAFWLITMPLSLSGVFAGCLLVFIPVIGEFVIPDLLGSSDTLMIGKVLVTIFKQNRDWPVASAVAIILLLILILPIVAFQYVQARSALKER